MEGNKQPLVSIFVLFYNHEKYVAETVAGALSQTYPNCEIILSDDCSTDNTYQEMKKAVEGYNGPHRIILNRNEINMGLVPHVNKVISIAKGEILCGNGGDDILLPNRAEDAVNYFIEDPELMALTMSYDIIDKYGVKTGEYRIEKDEYKNLTDGNYLNNLTMMWGTTGLATRKCVWDRFGPIADNCQTEDSVIRFRSILLGKVLTSKVVGLKRRVHETNMSHNLFELKTGPIANQYRHDLEIMSPQLKKEIVYFLRRKIDFYESIREGEDKMLKSSNPKRLVERCILKIKKKKYLNKLSALYNSINRQQKERR